ncbi:MAG TPA: hypothetical protein PKY35_05625 [Candidatus Hydrogenedentes bacterium]|nr:hypothetical protein [Candidatus Hydrogenedentota bacterium]HOL76491.1 hypothetical protein [Candidatus Hydrogenedentota bacterium]HPO85156.1 hypothetical protein [Candidatus Hydrogenedentota bacterium]
MSSEHSDFESRLARLERLQNTVVAIQVISLFLAGMIVLVLFVPELSTALRAGLSPDRVSSAINEAFGPLLRPIFKPIDTFLSGLSAFPRASRIVPSLVAIGYFVGTMVWVFVGLKKQFVNLDAPSQRIWHDLRFWTIVSMLPHVVVYLYFIG